MVLLDKVYIVSSLYELVGIKYSNKTNETNWTPDEM